MGWQSNTLSDGFDALTFGTYILAGDYNGAANYAAQFTLSQDEQNIVRLGLEQVGVNWTPPPTPQGPPAPTPTPTTTVPAATNTAPTASGSGPAPTTKQPAPIVSTKVPTAPTLPATTGVMPFVKDHKVLVSAALGGLVWFLTKKPIAGVAVGGGTYLVTDKVIK